MAGLGVSEAEAKEIYKSDCEIDEGHAQDFDLKGESLRTSRVYARQGIKKKKEESETANAPPKQKERKPDDEKIAFVSMLADFLSDKVQDMKIVNPSQKISFRLNNDDFSLTLTRHGKKKGGA